MSFLNEAMVTTAFELPGYRVVKSLGLVRGSYGPIAQHFGYAGRFAGNARGRQHYSF